MKVVILAGGMGSRLGALTDDRPKPMVEIGGGPMLWHIMRCYARFGHSEFVVALGYKGRVIKDYFLNYRAIHGDLTVRLGSGQVQYARAAHDDWTIHLVDTGIDTLTGGRLRRLKRIVGDATFMMTYGDGLASIDIDRLLEHHRRSRCLVTVTGVRPPARFGQLGIEGSQVRVFSEKPQVSEGWINGGFFVIEPAAIDLIDGDATAWEREPLERLARDRKLGVYCHDAFWQCVDTPRDLNYLESLWASGAPPWIESAPRTDAAAPPSRFEPLALEAR